MGCRTLRFPKWSKSVIHSSKVPKVLKFRDTFVSFATGRKRGGTGRDGPCTYACAYACARAHMHAHMHAHVHMCMHICMHICMRTCTYACAYACARAHMHAHMQRDGTGRDGTGSTRDYRRTAANGGTNLAVRKIVQQCDTFVTSCTNGQIP